MLDKEGAQKKKIDRSANLQKSDSLIFFSSNSNILQLLDIKQTVITASQVLTANTLNTTKSIKGEEGRSC